MIFQYLYQNSLPTWWCIKLFKIIFVEEETLTPVNEVCSPRKDDEIQENFDIKCSLIKVQEQEKEIKSVENDPEKPNTQKEANFKCSIRKQNTYSTNNRILEDISREFRR